MFFRLRLPTIFIVMVLGLGVGFVGCTKSAGPRTNSQPSAAGRQANAATLSPVAQLSQTQATTSSTASNKGKIDACTLLTSKEIQSIQGEPLKETKSSERSGDGFAVSQCYFALPTSSNSISLVVTQRGEGAGARDPKQFWKETFPADKDSERAREKDRGKDDEKDRHGDRDKGREKEEEEREPPLRVANVGDQAFWTGNPVGSALYVLKGNAFLRISIGGPASPRTKIDKSKALARLVLKNL